MKTKFFSAILALTSILLFSSCSEDNTTIINNTIVEMGKISLNTQELITEASTPFQAKGTPVDFVHTFPTGYKAYFVSKENRGNYTIGQVVAVKDVVSGNNDITVPMLDYTVYVTNYTGHSSANWYTWNDAVQQLPQTSHVLYLYGKSDINYSTATTGTVELANPYAGVQIRNNQWVTGVPKSYDTNQNYFVGNSDWYVLYIRNNNTNTMIPVSMPGYSGTHYTLSKSIQANKIYKFTVNGDVNWTGGSDNFIVEVDDFEAVYDEDVDILK